MKAMKGITCCGDCIHYNWKKHKCNLGCKDEGLATDHFYKDCPLPKVQPVNQWIPCSERLPEEYGNYLVTTDKDVDIGTFNPNKAKWSCCDADGFYWTHDILAWMPLPEPYKEGVRE